TAFGAFVSLLPGKDGLLHISQIRKLHGGQRIENLDDVISIGEKIQVEIREIDDRGKLSLVPVEVVESENASAPKAEAAPKADSAEDAGEDSDKGDDKGEGAPRRRRRRSSGGRSENT